MEKKKKTGAVFRILWIGLLSAVLFLVFRRDYPAIRECLSQVSAWGVFFLIGMGVVYQLLNSAAYFTLIRAGHLSFSYREAVRLAFLGVFGSISTASAGTIPLQSYYLYRRGLPVGNGIGMLMLAYIFHKTSIFFYAAVMLLFRRQWLGAVLPDLMKYIWGGFFLCLFIILVLILLCTWEKLQKLFLWGIEKLPEKGKWGERKVLWSRNLTALYEESRDILSSRSCCRKVFGLNLCKQFCLYTIPFICLEILGVSGPGFSKIQTLSALMLLMIGVLPGVAGVGPTEFAYLLLFPPFVGRVAASSSLLLYRVATYFSPFLISMGVFWAVKKDF